MPSTEEKLTTRPQPRSRMAGTKARQARSTWSRLTRYRASQSSSVEVSNGPELDKWWPRPFTRMSTRSNADRLRACSSSTAPSAVRSRTTPKPPPPAALDLGDHDLGPLGVEVGHDHVGAVVGQRHARRRADAARSPGDHGDPARHQ